MTRLNHLTKLKSITQCHHTTRYDTSRDDMTLQFQNPIFDSWNSIPIELFENNLIPLNICVNLHILNAIIPFTKYLPTNQLNEPQSQKVFTMPLYELFVSRVLLHSNSSNFVFVFDLEKLSVSSLTVF